MRNRVEEFRRSRQLTQEELANDLSVTRQTISSIEKGRYNPSIILAIRIARYFGRAVEEVFLYGGEEDGS